MQIIYNIGIYIVAIALKGIAFFNEKIKLGVRGRSQTFTVLKQKLSKNDVTIWFHCSSLGEYEQGLPVFEKIKKLYPKHKVILTFFSPSGYENKKKSSVADSVVYLPLDTKANAQKFLDIVNPDLTVFVKYDIWPNYLIELNRRKKYAILISALFRSNQSFFKFYGSLNKKALFAFNHIFTQNQPSKKLLNSIEYNSASVAGDTRFDRVLNQLKKNNTLTFIENFKSDSLLIVAGSTWQQDENFIVPFINSTTKKNVKFIIAPHKINTKKINQLKHRITKSTILFSEKESEDLQNFQVLILDTIGLLPKVYSYANITYIGGAVGNTGLHNTLEAAVFKTPIIIGKNYTKFPEAHKMIALGGMKSIKTKKELKSIFNTLIDNTQLREELGIKNFNYIESEKGAVNQIITYLQTVKKC